MTPQPREMTVPGSGPVRYEAQVLLRDGSTVRVRPVRPDDKTRLFEFLAGLSERSRSLRFFGAISDEGLRREAKRISTADGDDVFGMVVTTGREERILAHAMYARVDGDRAEIAFTVSDESQGRGIGTLLVGQLAQIACSRGVNTFEATILPENRKMLGVFRESGFPIETRAAAGEIHVEFPAEVTREALDRFEQREWMATVNAMKAFFQPRSVAVIGASRQRATIGGEILHNLLSYGFEGPVLPVNPNAEVVQSVLAYPHVEEVPGPVDLAVIVVPASDVLEVAEACGRKGARGLVVISAGFAEEDEEGRARQAELVRVCHASGMRLIGPNCMGIVNTHPEVRLNATFAAAPPPHGRIGFMSQSGALGLAIIDYAGVLGLGLSTFVSVGNKADVSGNDLIRYWEQDPDTDVILLYLESFGNPRKFSHIARRVAREKPIVAVKSGRTPAGERATGSHTGALIAASDVTVDALFRHAGVIRTDTLRETFDVAALLSNQSPPRGRRVAILTNAAGPGVLCADTCAAEGLEIPVLTEETREKLRAALPSEASAPNPVDMGASATAEQYREAIRIVGNDPDVDALIVIFIPPLVTRPEDVARGIVEGVEALERDVPVLSVFMQSSGVPAALRAADVRLPSYAFPEEAAIALARVTRYGEWRSRPVEPPARFDDVRRDEAVEIVASALGRGGGWLEPEELGKLLSCYGLPVLEQRMASTLEDAELAARELGGVVALKAVAQGLVHKSAAGAVRLNLAADQVPSEVRRMEERLRAAGMGPSGFLVQPMAPAGVEMIVGVVHDPQFGPVVACGAGGALVELVRDVSVRLAPLTKSDAEEMVRELRTYPLLTGHRGGEYGDVDALTDVVLRVGMLVEDLPQITELDLNPVLVHERGATIVDARVRVMPVEPSPLLGTHK